MRTSAWWIAPVASGCLRSFERAAVQECSDCRWQSLGASATTTHAIDRFGRMFARGPCGLGLHVSERLAHTVEVEGACWGHVRGGAKSEVHSCSSLAATTERVHESMSIIVVRARMPAW